MLNGKSTKIPDVCGGPAPAPSEPVPPTVTVLFSTSANPLSWLIRRITRSRVSHCALGIEEDGVPLILEAGVHGVSLVERARWLRRVVLVEEYEAPRGTRVRDATMLLGERYDTVGLLGFAWVALLWRWFKLKAKNPLASPQAVVCSELVCRTLAPVNKLFADCDPETIQPEELRLVCRASRLRQVFPGGATGAKS